MGVCSQDVGYSSPNAAGNFPQLPPTTKSPVRRAFIGSPFSKEDGQLARVATPIFQVDLGQAESRSAWIRLNRRRLSFPVLGAHEAAKTIRVSINEEPLHLQATGFVLRPDGQ